MSGQTKEERVHQVFESIYDQYDKMNAIISFQRHRAWRKDTMKRMSVENGAKALDVCCGTADWTIALAEATSASGEVHGLDFSENMLKVGQAKVDEAQLSHVTLTHGNAMDLPYPDNYFDYVTIGFGLRNVPDYMQTLKEMRRVVKPGGLVVCLETSHPTIPVYKQIFSFYFRYIMPLFGKLFAKRYEEYSWLQESTVSFPGKKELKSWFLKSGFKTCTYKSYSGGAAAAHFAYK
ncbi:demethylmenaquinone methyltransferase [Texcoconibacillus texcoconensis]|uniref:Demethylmenaquinone methyltransferase n=1 Tax=Texcoconibacillus texcoconensis TaxID=1095777 RepID=A0A840QND6_9BACI|nr:demethylmenaquinone methyltransferase [Texcoconibacillus texcoconensis]MBB5172896.1 demethylmenaquinone methyltransferase/2-methoxy-6-polyprenyl-1,4-benzoquinol methylase [Texcoconibacillus texcoconensis]